MIGQILFFFLTAVSVYLFTKKAAEIKRNIFLGKDDLNNDQPSLRWNNLLLLALGQKKMFKNPLVAIMHLVVYAGFIIINIEVVEIVLDGLLGSHRLFAAPLGGLYTFLINAFEILAALVIVVCAIFLIRRNIIRLNRFASSDLIGWPRSDANYILFTEIISHYGCLRFQSFFCCFQHPATIITASFRGAYSFTGKSLLVVAHYRHICFS